MTNYTREAIGGVRWTYLSTAASLLMTLGYSATVARLLEPRVFGLLASTQVILRFGSYAAELGLGPALVQKEELTPEDVRTAFTASALLGLVLAGGLALAAPAMAPLFDSADVVPVMRAMAATLLLTGLSLTAGNLLRRRLRFRTIAVIEVTTYAVGYLGIGLGLAAAGAGVWSLVAAILSQMALKSAWTLAAARHDLRPMLGGRSLRDLYRFGGMVSAISVLEYAGQAMIVVLVGRRAGQTALGQYNRAALLIDLPLVNLTFGLSDVLFPALSRMQADRERVARAYIGTIRVVAALVLPLGAGIAVAAPQLVRLVLGDRWGVAAAVVPALTGAAVMNVLTTFGGIVAEALDVLRTKLVLQAAYVAGLATALLLVPADDLPAYALAFFGAEVLRQVAYIGFMGRVLSLPLREQLDAYLRPLLAAGLVAAAIAGVTALVPEAAVPLVVAAQVATGAVVLLAAAAVGPLRPVRRELRGRIAGAYEDGGRASALAVRLLSLGDRPTRAGAGPAEGG